MRLPDHEICRSRYEGQLRRPYLLHGRMSPFAPLPRDPTASHRIASHRVAGTPRLHAASSVDSSAAIPRTRNTAHMRLRICALEDGSEVVEDELRREAAQQNLRHQLRRSCCIWVGKGVGRGVGVAPRQCGEEVVVVVVFLLGLVFILSGHRSDGTAWHDQVGTCRIHTTKRGGCRGTL